MRISRPWRVVAGAGSAALLVGLAATGVAASDDLGIRDQTDPVRVEHVDLEQPVAGDSAGSADSPFDDGADSPADAAASAATAASADSPEPAPPASSATSAASANSAASAASASSADSGDSADSAD